MTFDQWLKAPTDLSLSVDDVHVWRVELSRSQLQLQELAETLSSDEQVRAKRFHFEQHRQHFIAGRGILRTILGRYLGIEPQALGFDYEAHGKPVLGDKFVTSGLSFNLSHSQGLALYGVSRHPIGVDLECIRDNTDVEALAKRFFTDREYEVVRSLSPNQQQQIFFRYWTCKEAYLKATGAGLSQLEQVEILLTPTQPASLQSEEWSLTELIPANNYLAAVAVAGQNLHYSCWQY
ncbi:4'-phosphopantetheinyl transferase superfamily protein [Plectonema radiosum NIES-515]|uniref:4'-phosphopantetheinyl transferase superfamily protein n=1 Tax=Plectonema radiosum NIES-515 TaxID=2986073 RepID=A0ABT3B2D5_9CYAN|nr:4'-phosphopantetheinyl transferase HetI [Plectonema radiosum]MCV3215543.1 4'-phosphopantetheinyl transferase superfamily protein [Plectonema radiosum NIES-515]